MFYHSALWKRYWDQTTIIHAVNIVRAKGRVWWRHVNIYLCRYPLQNFRKHFHDADFPLCVMLELKYSLLWIIVE